jgi:predicted TIM-barrel fold metal-dependent hydrolase
MEPGRRPEQIRDRIEPGLVDEDGARMIARMDRADVAMSVILPIDWGPDLQSADAIARANDHALAMSRTYPGRFAAFVGVDPRRPGTLDMLTARIERGEVHGLKLYPGCGWQPASDDAMEIYAVVEKAGLPVLFHTGDPLPILDRDLSNPIHLLPVAESFPDLKIWLGHAGAPDWWDEACVVAEASANVKLEMSVWLWDDSDEKTRRLWLRNLTEARNRFGAERLLFGSDHVSGPKVRGDAFLDTIVTAYRSLPANGQAETAFTQREIDLILGLNALADLGLETTAANGVSAK